MCSAQKIICRHSSTLQLYWCQTRVHPCTPSFHPVLCSILREAISKTKAGLYIHFRSSGNPFKLTDPTACSHWCHAAGYSGTVVCRRLSTSCTCRGWSPADGWSLLGGTHCILVLVNLSRPPNDKSPAGNTSVTLKASHWMKYHLSLTWAASSRMMLSCTKKYILVCIKPVALLASSVTEPSLKWPKLCLVGR